MVHARQEGGNVAHFHISNEGDLYHNEQYVDSIGCVEGFAISSTHDLFYIRNGTLIHRYINKTEEVVDTEVSTVLSNGGNVYWLKGGQIFSEVEKPQPTKIVYVIFIPVFGCACALAACLAMRNKARKQAPRELVTVSKI